MLLDRQSLYHINLSRQLFIVFLPMNTSVQSRALLASSPRLASSHVRAPYGYQDTAS